MKIERRKTERGGGETTGRVEEGRGTAGRREGEGGVRRGTAGTGGEGGERREA